MQFSENKNTIRWVLIAISFAIVVLILWNTYSFFQIFKKEQRLKMELWANAQKTLINADEHTDVDLPLEIFSNNNTIPIILTENDSIKNTANIDDETGADEEKTKLFLSRLKTENEPIKIEYVPGKFQYLYYGDSSLINKLKYYPLALLLIIVLFSVVVYNFYRSTKLATQNKLWAGMAKETAHQIGTPLSSLIGWLEIMKADDVDATTIIEIEKDIHRLQTITDRFSKIGSKPVLELQDIIKETHASFDYLKSRFSQQIEFSFNAPNVQVLIPINAALHSWTIENLMKNAIDAMKGRGKLTIEIEHDKSCVTIAVSDSGKGMSKKLFHQIFEPGFTTKKRGWGLGLSLTKRIVEEYHNGKIRVLNSEINIGTTILITFKK